MALIITRKDGQTFLIGDDIIITVHITKGNQVKLAVEAPENILILRSELIAKPNELA